MARGFDESCRHHFLCELIEFTAATEQDIKFEIVFLIF